MYSFLSHRDPIYGYSGLREWMDGIQKIHFHKDAYFFVDIQIKKPDYATRLLYFKDSFKCGQHVCSLSWDWRMHQVDPLLSDIPQVSSARAEKSKHLNVKSNSTLLHYRNLHTLEGHWCDLWGLWSLRQRPPYSVSFWWWCSSCIWGGLHAKAVTGPVITMNIIIISAV